MKMLSNMSAAHQSFARLKYLSVNTKYSVHLKITVFSTSTWFMQMIYNITQ